MSTRPPSTPGTPANQLDRPIKGYFCLADGRTAALVNRQGGCDFWCWPNFDSPLRLAGLLDRSGGGSVGVGAASGPRPSPTWLRSSRVLSLYRPDRLLVRCGLLEDGAGSSALVWLVDGAPGHRVEIALADPRAGGGPGWSAAPFGAIMGRARFEEGPGGPLMLAVTAPTTAWDGGLTAFLPPGGLAVWLGAPGPDGRLPPRLGLASDAPAAALSRTRELLEAAVAEDQGWLAGLHAAPALAGLIQTAPEWAIGALDRSLLTLRGLQERRSGLLVAAPLTSIPQWPASERAWDYRYAWLRDCADAGTALSHAGARLEADAVAIGLAQLLGDQPALATPVRRLSGADLPPERVASHLQGYTGSPVRTGNGAAGQLQLDTLGEIVGLAGELDRTGGCPEQLLRQVAALADAAVQCWRLPDHGIWEVRGKPQDYTHSKVMAWAALRTASDLADQGRIQGHSPRWRAEAALVRGQVEAHGRGPNRELVMSFQEPEADSALLAAYLVSFINPEHRDAPATLQRISDELGRGPVMARHWPERDQITAPCFPFIFPGLWAAVAEAKLGRRRAAQARIRAICQLAGASGQLSEVVDPESGALWGNYPQVQSHAALVEAILAAWRPGPSPERDPS